MEGCRGRSCRVVEIHCHTENEEKRNLLNSLGGGGLTQRM